MNRNTFNFQELKTLINDVLQKHSSNSSNSNNRKNIDINPLQTKQVMDIYIQTESQQKDTKLIVMQLMCKINDQTIGHAALVTDPIYYDRLLEKTKYLDVLGATSTEDIFSTIMNWLKNDLLILFKNIDHINLHNRYFTRDFEFFLGPQRLWLSDANITYKPILILPEKVLCKNTFTSKDRKKLFTPDTFSASGNFQLYPNVDSKFTLETKRKVYSIFKQPIPRYNALESKLFIYENRNGIKLIHDSKIITFLLHKRFGWNKNVFKEFYNLASIIQNPTIMPDQEEEDDQDDEYDENYTNQYDGKDPFYWRRTLDVP